MSCDPTLTFVSGKMRQGKTVLNAIFALMMADEGTIVHTNLSLFDENGKGVWDKKLNGGLGGWTGKPHPNARVICPYDLVIMMEGERCEQTELIFLQEVYGWFNSHKAFSDASELEDTFVFQSGKLNYSWRVDTQLTMRVGGSLRKMATERYEAEKDLENQQFIYYELDTSNPNEDVRTGEESTLLFEIASMYWDRYDTWERSKPIGLAESKLKMAKTDSRIMDRLIEEQTLKLMPKLSKYNLYTAEDINVTRVKNALMNIGEPVGFASFVAERCKLRLKYMQV